MQLKQRLDALTSLRFFAAAMIVFHHSIGYGLFGLGGPLGDSSPWGQGVSFFFVLSGFILAYVYPKLSTWVDIRSFYRARIARVWPALAFSSFLAIGLLSLDFEPKTVLANLAMVNAWIPYPSYFYSYNAPAWSISTEFFFYLVFPVLIYRWEQTWRLKLLAAGLIVAGMILISDAQHLPDESPSDDALTLQALLYISPITRIFEFIFGILVESLWAKNKNSVNWGESKGNAIETAAILAVVIFMVCLPILRASISQKDAFLYWLGGSGSMFASGFLIYVIAIGRGRITAWLSHPMFVLLGEISFSLYLLHQILLRFYQGNILAFPQLPDLVSFGTFWIVLLLSSYLVWSLVEMPLRRQILGKDQARIHGTDVLRRSWNYRLNWNRNTGMASIVLACIVTTIGLSFDYSATTYLKRKHIDASVDALTFYAGHGDLKMVDRLIEVGIDVSERSSAGSTALIEASWQGDLPIVKRLLERGADPNFRRPDNGLTALKAATANSKMDVVETLKAAGTSRETLNKRPQNAAANSN